MKIISRAKDIELSSGGGTINLSLTEYVEVYNITGSGTLAGNYVIQANPAHTPKKGMVLNFLYNATMTLATNNITICGQQLTAGQAAKKCIIQAVYSGSAWVVILIDPTPSIIFDVITGAGLDTDGSYIVNEEANYIDEATSIADATDILDTKAKDLEDRMVEVEKALFGYFDIIIPHEEILTLNTVEVDVTAEAGADQVFIVTELAVKFYCLGTAYEDNTSFGLKYSDGGATFLPIGTGLLESTSSVEYLYNGAANFSVNNYIGKKIVAFVETGDPTGGEAGQYVRIKGTYKIIEFDEA